MQSKTYTWILYVISAVIVATICIQVYWNYKNYQVNKQQLINEIQTSLDKAVDDYYTALAQNSTVGFTFKGDSKNIFGKDSTLIKLLSNIDSTQNKFKNLKQINSESIEGVTIYRGADVKLMDTITVEYARFEDDQSTTTFLKNHPDSVQKKAIEFLTSKIVISIKNDSLDLREVDSLLKTEFSRKKISVNYQMHFNNTKKQQSFWLPEIDAEDTSKTDSLSLGINATAKSSFLPAESVLNIYFTNETPLLLKRISGGILLSTLLILGVIGCLFYLLYIIKQQKQLAEIKDDLISNITHEFKTPIATIGVALESLKDFDALQDTTKSLRYLNLSEYQLQKLNTMVEKLMETATLSKDDWALKKESFDLKSLLNTIYNEYKLQFQDKQFTIEAPIGEVIIIADTFQIENAINNLLDNAIKYGGDEISVKLHQNEKEVCLEISDSGTSISKKDKARIFEKFYRIPKGNTHDVKGFGIGLYYTKTIINQHQGNISVELNKNNTTFKITLPNG